MTIHPLVVVASLSVVACDVGILASVIGVLAHGKASSAQKNVDNVWDATHAPIARAPLT